MHEKQVGATINVLLIQEDEGCWSAQCLEYDLAAQAKTLSSLYYEFQRVLVSHIAVHEARGIEPFECLSPAPREYWNMFHNAKLHVVGKRVPFRTPTSLRYAVSIQEFRIADAA